MTTKTQQPRQSGNAPYRVNEDAVRAFEARLSAQRAAAAPLTTTLLAARLSHNPRFLRDGDDGGLFRELSAKYGEDFTGIAYIQACLKTGQERRARPAASARAAGEAAHEEA